MVQDVKEYNMAVCGIGGQGNIVASRLFANAAMEEGYGVRVGELYGSAQRGGSVISHVRIGEVFGPMIPSGRADSILSLEQSEILRYTHLLSRNAFVLINHYEISPVDVKLGKVTYPSAEEIGRVIAPITKNVKFVNATEEVHNFQDPRAANVLMLGMLAGATHVPISTKSIERAIENYFSARIAGMNLEVFRRGIELGRSL